MDAIDIKYHLNKRGYQLKDVAAECGKSESAVSNQLHRRPFKSNEIRERIAGILNRDVSEIWND